jgi:hypothetical protein
MTAMELLTSLQRQGFNLTPLPEGKLAVKPAEKLTDSLRKTIRQRKAEVLALLEAVSWLRAKLASPQRIAPLVAECVGERDGSTGRWMDDLMEARWALRVIAYVGNDDRLWWRLPQETVQ